MKHATINLYSFSELGKDAKAKAIQEHQEFLADLSLSQGENYADKDDAEVIESIETNDYLFFGDGTLAHCTTYTGKHPKEGQTDFKLHGEFYPVA